MTNAPWTFEALAQADAATLEQVLRASGPPDLDHLVGYSYDGYNCASARYIQLPAKKFRKAFFTRNDETYGLNQFVEADDSDVGGEWRVKTKQGKPVEGAYFRAAPAVRAFSRGSLACCHHLIGLNYNVDPNPRWHLVMRAIYDVVGLPNEGDYDVLLGKAYLRMLPGVSLFATYFVLGRRAPYSGASLSNHS